MNKPQITIQLSMIKPNAIKQVSKRAGKISGAKNKLNLI